MIKLRDVEKSYRSGAGETFVLRRIDSEIEKGEFVTIMGPSGAGKSREAAQAETRRSALFWLAQSEDPRVVPFLEEILVGRGRS